MDEFASRLSMWYNLRTTSEGSDHKDAEKANKEEAAAKAAAAAAALANEILVDPEVEKRKINSVLYLDPQDTEMHDQFRLAYAEQLAVASLFIKATEVRKTVMRSLDQDDLPFMMGVMCNNCRKVINRLGSVAGPVNQATGRSEFEDGLGSGDCVGLLILHECPH
jgi:hypothetical protein